MTAPSPNDDPSPEYDSVYLNSRRESLLVFGVWVAAFLWAVPYSYLTGYPAQFDPEKFSTIWGIPSWLFWGIAVPWIVANVITTWFCFCYMQDDDLGEAHEGADVDEDLSGPTADRKGEAAT